MFGRASAREALRGLYEGKDPLVIIVDTRMREVVRCTVPHLASSPPMVQERSRRYSSKSLSRRWRRECIPQESKYFPLVLYGLRNGWAWDRGFPLVENALTEPERPS